jgi:hypothetical protein
MTLVKNWKRTSPVSDRSVASLGSGLPYLAMNSLIGFYMVSPSITDGSGMLKFNLFFPFGDWNRN